MKQIMTVLMSLLLWQNAFALFDPGHSSKPISSAKMDVLVAYGVFEGVDTIHLSKWSVALESLFVKASEMNKNRYNFQLNIEDSSVQLKVVSTERDSCGSQLIVLEEEVSTLPGIPASATMSYKLIDHSNRLCEDFRPHIWEMDIEYIDSFAPETNGKLVIGGNPEAIYTIMAQ